MPTKASCTRCSKSFSVKPYKLKQRAVFCSKICKNAYQTKSVTYSCDYCKAIITNKPSRFNRTNSIFCSHKCSAQYRSQKAMLVPQIDFRKYRTVPLRYKKLYGTSCVLCDFDRVVEYAHLIPAHRGGTVHVDNIIPLCPNHHTLYDKNQLNESELDVISDFMLVAWGSENSINWEEVNGQADNR